jgi:hypothetical protein
MRAEEARKVAERFTPDVKEVIEIIVREANNGGFSTSGASRFLYDEKVRKHLEEMGYKTKWHDVQRDGYWEISW